MSEVPPGGAGPTRASRVFLLGLSWSPALLLPASAVLVFTAVHQPAQDSQICHPEAVFSQLFITIIYSSPTPWNVNTMDILYVCLCIVHISVPYMYKGYDSSTSWEPIFAPGWEHTPKRISLLPTDGQYNGPWLCSSVSCMKPFGLPQGVFSRRAL